MDVLGLFRITRLSAARRADADSAPAQAEERGAPPPGDGPVAEPPAMARELIAMADRLVDLTGGGAPADPAAATAALRWAEGRVNALLAQCEIAPIRDEGALDLMRHEVVGDRPAPRPELIDHIAATVRPGYVWRHDLLRAQQVLAYIPAP